MKNDYNKWHLWFAWKPVLVEDPADLGPQKLVWMRRLMRMSFEGEPGLGKRYAYRFPFPMPRYSWKDPRWLPGKTLRSQLAHYLFILKVKLTK